MTAMLSFCAKLSHEVDAGDRGPMERLSLMFTSLTKSSRNRDERELPFVCQPTPAPAVPSDQAQEHTGSQFFFEYLVVVSLRYRNGSYEPQITYQFPKQADLGHSQREEEEKSLKAITLFCFPEGVNWAPLTEYPSETFSFVLTEIDGSRRNGYCRRLLPYGKGARPPEAYCIISKVACFGLFSKIFDEVEKRRQKSMAMIYPFMQSLREAPFPAPGKTVKIKSFIPESGTEIISLTRPSESWLEHVDFRTLFRRLSDQEVLQVFASTAMERRVIFVADELSVFVTTGSMRQYLQPIQVEQAVQLHQDGGHEGSTSSSGTYAVAFAREHQNWQVINAVAALLNPFTWQHTFISIVPTVLVDVVMAPTPYLLGVQRYMLDQVVDQSDMLIVDLSAKAKDRFIASIGDEHVILPEKLQEELLEALCAKKEKSTPEELNTLVSEAFLLFFIKTVGHLSSHVKRSSSGKPGVFQKNSFCKAVEPKDYQQFVKNFMKTQMFDLFIQDVERQPATQEGFFYKKVAEYQEKKRKEKSKSGLMRHLKL